MTQSHFNRDKVGIIPHVVLSYVHSDCTTNTIKTWSRKMQNIQIIYPRKSVNNSVNQNGSSFKIWKYVEVCMTVKTQKT